MASDIFLKVDGIKGESTDVNHKDEIEVLSWSWGVTQTPGSSAGSGASSGKPNISELVVGKLVVARRGVRDRRHRFARVGAGLSGRGGPHVE